MSKEIDKMQVTGQSLNFVIFSKHFFMAQKKFRKLQIDLPRQPVVNQRPWLIAGLLLVFIILLIAACNYYVYKKRLPLPEEQGKKALNRTGLANGIS